MVFYLTIGDTLVVSDHTPINLVPTKITWKMCIEEGLAVYFIIIISKYPARLHGSVLCGKRLEGGVGIVKGLGAGGGGCVSSCAKHRKLKLSLVLLLCKNHLSNVDNKRDW